MQELVHFSATPLVSVQDAEPATDWRAYHKPRGLWLSVGEAWLEWCVAESFALDKAKFVTRVELSPCANILRLESVGDLLDFTKTYTLRPPRYPHDEAIDWTRVMADYDAILIPEYHWPQRFELDWYYSWDVASGCIWKARAVATLGPSLPILPEHLARVCQTGDEENAA